MSSTKLKDAIKEWEKRTGEKAAEAEHIKLYGFMPSIEKMDSNTLVTLKNCKHLSLSSNNITKIGNLSGLTKLQILSLGRNQIQKFENLESVAGTLEQLWISYNLIEKLSGIQSLKKLKVLYMSNNRVEKWSEFGRLQELQNLQDLLFTGNPLERQYADNNDEWRQQVIKRLPNLKRLDGKHISDEERERATGKGK